MTDDRETSPEVIAALDRVLTETGRHTLGNDFDTSELIKLLDPSSTKRSLRSVIAQQRRPALAKQRRSHFEKAAKLAAELHGLLTDNRYDVWTYLKGLERGSGFPIGEWEGDPWDNTEDGSYPANDPPDDAASHQIGSYHATVNGIARLHDRLSAFIATHGDEPFIDPDGFSENEELITGAVTSAWNVLKGRDKQTPGSHSHIVVPPSEDEAEWTETHKTDGPFVRFAVAVMKELGREVAPGTVAKAVTKAKARPRQG